MLSMPEIKSALTHTELGECLDENDFDRLLAYSQVISFLPGDYILRQGNQSEGVYLIVEGEAIVTTKTLGSNNPPPIATLMQADFVGEISLLTHEKSAISVIAITRVTALFISNVYLDFLSLFLPELKYKIFLAIAKEVSRRISLTCEKIVSFLATSDMTTQPLLGQVIRSFKKTMPINTDEVDLDKLKKTEFFSLFTDKEYETLMQQAQLVRAAKHCRLIDVTENNPNCYIVIYGGVQSSIVYNNIIAKLSVIGPINWFCGTKTVDPKSPANINFTTCEQAILLQMTQANLSLLQKENNPLWNKLFSLIYKSLIALEKSVQKLNIRLSIELYNR